MYNLLVKGHGWSGRRDDFPLNRIYIKPHQEAAFKISGKISFDTLRLMPALFVEETRWDDAAQVARVGDILAVHGNGGMINIEYRYDPAVPPIRQSELVAMAPSLGIEIPRRGIGPLEHTHWAVKEADLFRTLMTECPSRPRVPNVFSIPESQMVQPNLLSAMMPFSGFDGVWRTIQRAAENNGMEHGRADNRWDHPAIIQDVVALIDEAAIVICDCSGKNANVFYEMGIAHSLGKEVIIITQDPKDIPFDIAHLRHIRYLNNGEGLQRLEEELTARISSLRTR